MTTKKTTEKRKKKNSFAQEVYGTEKCPCCNGEGLIADFFGSRVAKLRLAAGYSDTAVAGHIGVSLRRYHMIENGTTVPNLINVAFLASEFACSTDYLLGLTDKIKG